MKRLITSVIIIIFISSLTTSAQPPGFTVMLGENMNYVVDMIQTSSGTFIIAGTTTVQDQVFITEISAEGELLWSKFFDGKMLWYSDILQTSNGNILIPMSRSDAFLLEINHLGDSVSSLSINEPQRAYFESVIEMPGSTYFASEILYSDDPFFYAADSCIFVKLSSDLSIIDKYPSQLSDIKDLIVYLLNEFYALGEDYDHHSVNSLLLKMSSEGQVLSSSSCASLDPYLHNISRLNSSAFISAGYCDGDDRSMQAVLSIYDIDGQTSICNEYPGSYFMSLTKDESSEIIYALGDTNDSCAITAINHSGNIISNFIVDDSLEGNTIIFDNNYLYIAGVYDYFTSPRACLVKIHKDAMLSLNEDQDNSFLKVYPNPAMSYFIAEYAVQTTLVGSLELMISDISGSVLQKIILPGNSGHKIISTKELKPGLYLCKFVVDGKEKQTIKLSVIK